MVMDENRPDESKSAHCCGPATEAADRWACCPVNGMSCERVSYRTVLHHVRSPMNQALPEQRYFFCPDPDCNVVYFGTDRRLLRETDIREDLANSNSSMDRTVCYCFGITAHEVITDPGLKNFVEAQTRRGNCACEIRNPSGKCCLTALREI